MLKNHRQLLMTASLLLLGSKFATATEPVASNAPPASPSLAERLKVPAALLTPALEAALTKGDIEGSLQLLRMGADPLVRGQGGRSLLALTVFSEKVLRAALETIGPYQGLATDAVSQVNTAVTTACRQASLTSAERLLDYGFSVPAAGAALNAAATAGRFTLVERLLAMGVKTQETEVLAKVSLHLGKPEGRSFLQQLLESDHQFAASDLDNALSLLLAEVAQQAGIDEGLEQLASLLMERGAYVGGSILAQAHKGYALFESARRFEQHLNPSSWALMQLASWTAPRWVRPFAVSSAMNGGGYIGALIDIAALAPQIVTSLSLPVYGVGFAKAKSVVEVILAASRPGAMAIATWAQRGQGIPFTLNPAEAQAKAYEDFAQKVRASHPTANDNQIKAAILEATRELQARRASLPEYNDFLQMVRQHLA